MASARHVTGYVYFLEAPKSKLIKIGYGSDVKRRVMRLQTGSPERLCILGVLPSMDPINLERHLHRKFADLRVHGEWFKRSPGLTRLLNTLLPVDIDGLAIDSSPQPIPRGAVVISPAVGESVAALTRRVCAVSAALGFPIPA